jgi:phage terminase large subunit
MSWRDNPWFTGVLKQEMEDLKAENYQEYLHVYEGQCRAAVEGAIFAEQLQIAHNEQRIGNYKYDARYPVSCFWDLGWADNTSIWFIQFVNNQIRVIDCYQNQFKKTPFYVGILQEKKYNFDRIVLPHDATAEHANADRTWLQIVSDAFPNARVYAGARQAVELRLEAMKNMFGLLHIDQDNCVDGLNALAYYHFAIDPDTGRTGKEPFHGPESNYSDAFGYMCLELYEPKEAKTKKKKRSIYAGQ